MRRRVAITACALSVLWLVSVKTESPFRVNIRFPARSTVLVSVLAGAIDEAAGIWSPYGITVGSDPVGGTPVPTTVLLVDLDVDHDGGASLGEIRFATDGIPDSSVTLYYRAVVRLVNASEIGSAARQLPVAVQTRILSRALGRALAHEVGHFVLRSPHHSLRGLMRSRQPGSMLTDPSRKPFRLTDVDRARLQVVLAARAGFSPAQTY